MLRLLIICAFLLGLGIMAGMALAVYTGCERGTIGEQQLHQFQSMYPSTKLGDFVIARHCWQAETAALGDHCEKQNGCREPR